MFKTSGAAAFTAAWRALCKAGPTPHYRTVFELLPADILPRVIIVEHTPEGKNIIRFMGTSRVEMWGEDLTGKDPLGVMSQGVAAAARVNIATMIKHPCGMHHIAQYTTPTGRDVEMENITVPVGNDPGLPQRLLNFADEMSTVAYGDPVGEMRSVSKRVWFDVGAGVPAKPPQK